MKSGQKMLNKFCIDGAILQGRAKSFLLDKEFLSN